MTIKALYQGKTVEVEVDKGTMYDIFHEQQFIFDVADVLERVGEYFRDSGVEDEEKDTYLNELESDIEKMRDIVEMFRHYEGIDDAYYGRRSNRDEALEGVRADIEEKFDIEICV